MATKDTKIHNKKSLNIQNNRLTLTTVLKSSKISMILDDSSTIK